MTKYLGFADIALTSQGVWGHKPKIFGHGNTRWNLKKISSFRERHSLLWCVDMGPNQYRALRRSRRIVRGLVRIFILTDKTLPSGQGQSS